MEDIYFYGLFYGYPICCIEYHIEKGVYNGITWNGYCPCPEHAKLDYKGVVKMLGRCLIMNQPDFKELDPEKEKILKEEAKKLWLKHLERYPKRT